MSVAQGVYAQLDEQKQENLLLKETIDRMRFEMDEMRANAALGLPPGGSGGTSTANTISKSLGAELMGKLKWEEGRDGDDEGGGEEEGSEEGKSLDTERSEGDDSTTAVEVDEDDEDDEDVIQTIITRKKRVRLSFRCSFHSTHE